MKLSEKIASFFDKRVRSRGSSCFRSGSVVLLELEKNRLEAEILGSAPYQVVLMNPRKNHLLLSCTCPYYVDETTLCKHIWATVLTAENRGWSPNLPGPEEYIEIIPSDDLITNDEFDEEEEDEIYVGDEDDDWDILDEEEIKTDHQPIDEGDVFAKLLEQVFGGHVQSPKTKPVHTWQMLLDNIKDSMVQRNQQFDAREKQLIYTVDIKKSLENSGVYIEVLTSEKRKDGNWGKPQRRGIDRESAADLDHELDREIIGSMFGAKTKSNGHYDYYNYHRVATSDFVLPIHLQQKILKQICSTKRAKIRLFNYAAELRELQWDDAGSWELKLRVSNKNKSYGITGFFARGNERLSMDKPLLLIAGGLIFWDNKVAPLIDHGSFAWISMLRKENRILVPLAQGMQLLENIYGMPKSPPIELPKEMQLEPVYPNPGKELILRTSKNDHRQRPPLTAEVNFRYQDVLVPASNLNGHILKQDEKKVIHRNQEQENLAFQELTSQGFNSPPQSRYHKSAAKSLEITMGKLPQVVPALLKNQWKVEADGKLYRQAGAFSMNITSDIDWFELHGKVEFDELVVNLPQVLAAMKKGKGLIELGDGSFGVLPEEWIEKYAPLVGLGEAKEEHIQFKKHQTGILDALIASQPEIDFDSTFSRIRDHLMKFDGLKPKDPPKNFNGVLREYQKEGLGWLDFLENFGLGGCLADDMGLGKTVQMLALLGGKISANGSPKQKKPSIIIVPRSLLFNWQEEARKFTPKLKVLVYSGADRKALRGDFGKFDLILTTYGTLRRDIPDLTEFKFDYAVLDEAQAIKNPNSQSAKATRLLNAEHRLALSGTPIENHLGELWSLFEFLNPGMLGKVKTFNTIKDDGSREILKRALRPFILRRTKSQVAKDLPEKTEQTIYCEMDKKQQRMYNELKNYYQASLLGKIENAGINKVKIQVLEALLRLRQAACHPGLIDKDRTSESSCKLDSLWEQLSEILAGGHKALIFSQFTSFLSILQRKLHDEKIPYLYLDGKTRKRQERVDIFQNEDKCKLFLISLKAGGLGLNLTAAEYVFILDPWWNPAVEAQAIDRAHRIGQTKSVFAYRIISRGTVEEKILELQKNKKQLAESIITEDNSIIKNLTQDDLSYLLS